MEAFYVAIETAFLTIRQNIHCFSINIDSTKLGIHWRNHLYRVVIQVVVSDF